jgi:hypothetical protein
MDSLLGRLAVNLRMLVKATLVRSLRLLHYKWVRESPCILPNSGELPGYLQRRATSRYLESVVSNLLSNEHWRRLTNAGELISKVSIYGL